MDNGTREYIRTQLTPASARKAGRRRDLPLRPDWEAIKEQVMLEGLRAKFSQHPRLRQRLLETGDRPLVEASPYDSYWGIGSSGLGKNRLGALLMKVREECRNAVGVPKRDGDDAVQYDLPAPPQGSILHACSHSWIRVTSVRALRSHKDVSASHCQGL